MEREQQVNRRRWKRRLYKTDRRRKGMGLYIMKPTKHFLLSNTSTKQRCRNVEEGKQRKDEMGGRKGGVTQR